MNSEKQIVLGFAWYRQDQWDLLKLLSVDSHELEATYDQWETEASKRIYEMQCKGIRPIRITVDVHELARWCKAKGVPMDGNARVNFVTEQL